MKREKESLHQRLINALCSQDSRIMKFGFRKAIFEASPYASETIEDGSTRTYYDEEVGSVIPDAYFIDHDVRFIYIFEVEVTSFVKVEKLEAYQNLFWLVDQDCWQVEIIVVDRYGVGTAVDTLHLCYANVKDPAEMRSAGTVFKVHQSRSFYEWLRKVRRNIKAQREADNHPQMNLLDWEPQDDDEAA